ncbi:protein kinase, partial [Planococcus sp. APC 4015]|nr:protein kinase [Planococcus sp. APC 4015]
MTRPPSPPPDLPGFRYVEPLGTGGFADVFLYEQEMPRRQVAVKVLLADRITSGAAQEFADEANVMAMLSTHPAIVTIHQAGVAGDGRPYLVMEYCPRPNLQARARKESFSIAEALRVGVQVAGAVETAHRAGVLHRDIKPANILVTAYNRPALTDFGIASTTGATGEASGMSIPWSPPESFADPPQSGPRTDVWALGATLYTLLAGRSPFERPGERNSSADLIERIERAALTSLNRPDAPDSLQRVLERTMAKNPDDRYPSAVAFARALQKVQIELSHSVTPIDIVDDHAPAEERDDDGDGLTRVREIVSIDPEMAAFTRPSAATQPKSALPPLADVPSFDSPARLDAVDEATQMRVPSAPAPPVADDRTIVRPPMVVAPHAAPESRSSAHRPGAA